MARPGSSNLGRMQRGRTLAAFVVCLGLFAHGSAVDGRGRRPPCHSVSVVQGGQSHNLGCVIRKAQPPTNGAAVFVCVEVPEGVVLESATVSTPTSRSDVLVSSAVSWSGPYMLTIDATKVDCAASGSFSLVLSSDSVRVDGFARQTVPCAALPLFRPEACGREP